MLIAVYRITRGSKLEERKDRGLQKKLNLFQIIFNITV